jgi:hypothetical protein
VSISRAILFSPLFILPVSVLLAFDEGNLINRSLGVEIVNPDLPVFLNDGRNAAHLLKLASLVTDFDYPIVTHV